jgi:hypothetical protein
MLGLAGGKKILSKVSGINGIENSCFDLLSYGFVQYDRWLPTFQKKELPPSSGRS